ncbi:CpsD/CapB family tyrosine-protein kinase [Paenilisteria rocourtiae]|uniref:Capsular exopolysaccharide synthesis family protein n=1 Tax=Listeria rocourtiae TaxID=647910 RepID=A0A4V3DPK1_9LIST|nr:CpsD/CapB family tyrosine-protein kinase [Listeria rocourtiae]EUJ47827.1 capsular exopolysaccharide family protein [Listeria rocourtiae FSL F6-920]MBC1604561.1 CpsD/CapB family tyrosine-protein kinase [Listeria rocourtiae]TDR52616.1 capsular exopolysaccharide synthesis family protein [Listeria rocourtiae]
MIRDKLALNRLDTFYSNKFRDLRVNVEHRLKNKKDHIIVITSANQGDGKSYCALHLALAFAEANRKVLLIDYDLHRSQLSKNIYYGYHGVSAMFNDQLALEDALIPVGENISFLPSGYTSLDPSVVANSKQIYSEINRCAADYDVVLIDSPPINFSPDTKFIISEFKNLLFIIGANHTQTSEVTKAFEQMQLINPTILGLVLNKKQFSKKEYKRYEYK